MGLWTVFCGVSDCLHEDGNKCSSGISAILSPYSCFNHFLVISVDILLFFILLFIDIHKFSLRNIISPSECRHISLLSISSAVFNGSLSLAYLGLGIWKINESWGTEETILHLHEWLAELFQGFTWLMLWLSLSFKKQQAPQVTPLVKVCSIITFLLVGFLCASSVREVFMDRPVTIKMVLDMSSFPGAILLFFDVLKGHKYTENDGDVRHNSFYMPLKGHDEVIGKTDPSRVTTFSMAMLLSKLSFWWLNPLMKKGKEKTITEEDIPHLRKEDQAQTCYLQFMEQLREWKQINPRKSPSVLLAVLYCQRKAILVSGLYALIKVLTLSTGPLFLYAFIRIAEGKQAFKNENYALTFGLFLSKFLESLSERQWNFQTRLTGLQVRSLLSAAIYQKQLRLSNAAKTFHSPGEIMNYVTVDAYRIGEFPFWIHQIWTTGLQICLALIIMYYSVGLATIAAVIIIIISVLGNYPVAKLQYKFLTKLMGAQDRRLKTITEALMSMKVLKMYAWETHFKSAIELLRTEETCFLSAVQWQKGYYIVLFWSSPIIVSAVTFWTCYLLGIPLNTSNVFMFLATLRIVQEPIRLIPDVAGVFIEANVSFSRIVKFLEAPELNSDHIRKNVHEEELEKSVVIDSTTILWDADSLKPTLTDINLLVKRGEKVAICGGVGSGKSTLLATILGEVPYYDGTVQVHGKIAYVSQTAWIQTGTIQQNILFGLPMDENKYQDVLKKCFLLKDLEMLPFGDCTIIGERGVNLSGGQKQRLQLARALYQDADLYLLDDPFSAVDAHTATGLFNEYIMGALSGKTVVLVTHQVDFLPSFDSVLLMSDGKILKAATYHQLLASSQEFQNLVNAHNDTAFSGKHSTNGSSQRPRTSNDDIQENYTKELLGGPVGDQLIKQEEREIGNTGLKPYGQYLSQSKGFLYLSLAVTSHLMYLVGQLAQNFWLASELENSNISSLKLILIYLVIGCGMSLFLVLRSYVVVILGLRASKAIFSKLMTSLFRAPMSFYDSTPLGRILSRVSLDLNTVDLELSIKISMALASTMTTYFCYGTLAVLTWPILFIIIPMIYVTMLLQSYYFSSSKELMRIDGTTKSLVASHIAESIAGAATIRAFSEEDRFFTDFLHLVDSNASPCFHSFSANEWLIQRLEIICTIVLSSSALAMTLIDLGASSSGFVGIALSYGLSLNIYLVGSVQIQCILANLITSVERLEKYMHIPGEAPEVIEASRPAPTWPSTGKVEISDLKVRYQPNAPLVLRGVSCIFEGGHKIGIVGRTGSGKTTLISSLFRLVEPSEGMIRIDDVNIANIGLHDLRSHFGVIPQEPTLFSGSVRYNLDPLSEHTNQEIWEILEKCQLRDVVQKKEKGLDSLVVQDGSNWSMGQRQLFCLGRVLLKRRKILVLDEATASIDNATDFVIQRTIRTEFSDCTVITVAHRIPTVMDCTMVLAMSDGKFVEYDQPQKLISKQGSLFGQLVKEYWSHSTNTVECLDK